MTFTKSILTLLCLTISIGSWAQTPQKLNYQAVLRALDNTLISNQSVGMQISIIKGSVSGTAVYVETQNPSTSGEGLISIAIGTGSVQTGDFTTIDWSTDSYFVKIETDPTGGDNYTISATSELMSVPFALHAKTAESVSNLSLSSVTDGSLEIQNGAMVITNLTTVERDAITNPPSGTLIYNTDENKLQVASVVLYEGATAIDQGALSSSVANNFAQIYVPEKNNDISEIEIISAVANSVTLNIYEGEGNDGSLLYTGTQNVSVGVNSFTLASPVSVVEGTTYTIQFSGCECSYSGLNPYLPGQIIDLTGGTSNASIAAYDLYFKVIVASGFVNWIDL